MHEWSIAEALKDSIVEAVEKRGAKRVLEVVIGVGELSMIDMEILDEAFRLVSERTPIEGAKILFELEPTKFRCERCGYEWRLRDALDEIKREVGGRLVKDEGGELDLPLHYMPDLVYAYARCPRCGSRDIVVEGGRGVYVKKLVVEA